MLGNVGIQYVQLKLGGMLYGSYISLASNLPLDLLHNGVLVK